jgi:hypothetical protein
MVLETSYFLSCGVSPSKPSLAYIIQPKALIAGMVREE